MDREFTFGCFVSSASRCGGAPWRQVCAADSCWPLGFTIFCFFGAERKFVLQETLGCENRLKNCAALEFGRELQ
jgi:hypothetical protein